MAVVYLKVLGRFAVTLPSGEAVEIPIRKGQALLAYLALHPEQVMPRAKLASLLWGDYGDSQARTNLRRTLAELRKALSPLQDEVLWADRQSISFNHECVEVDALCFQELVARGAPGDLEKAVALYRSDLLDGLEVPDPGFQEWLEFERRRLRELIAEALGALIEHTRAAGATRDAIKLGQRLLNLDPLQEGVHRTLMMLYSELGQRQSALQQYQRCRELLERELGVEPEPETEALYRALRDNQSAGDGAAENANAVISRWERDLGDAALDGDRPTISHAALTKLSRKPVQWAAALGLVFVIGGISAFGLLQPTAPLREPAPPDRLTAQLAEKSPIDPLPIENILSEARLDLPGEPVAQTPAIDPPQFEDDVPSTNESRAERPPPANAVANIYDPVTELPQPAGGSGSESDSAAHETQQSLGGPERQATLNPPAPLIGGGNSTEPAPAAPEEGLRTPALRAEPATVAPSAHQSSPERKIALRPTARGAAPAAADADPPLPEVSAGEPPVATAKVKPRSDPQIAGRPPAEPEVAAEADKPSGVVSRAPADDRARDELANRHLLSDWHQRSDMVREAIAQSRQDDGKGIGTIWEFHIVRVTPSSTNNHMVELETVYSVRPDSPHANAGWIETVNFQQTVLVDTRTQRVVEISEAVAGVDMPDRARLAAIVPDTLDPSAHGQDLLSSHQRRFANIVRNAIAQSRPELKDGSLTFGDIEIVAATPVDSRNRLIELETVYTLKYAYGSLLPEHGLIDEEVNYHQTVIVDQHDLSVVKVGEAVTGDGGSKFAQPQKNSIDEGTLLAKKRQPQNNSYDEETLLAETPEPPAWADLGGG